MPYDFGSAWKRVKANLWVGTSKMDGVDFFGCDLGVYG